MMCSYGTTAIFTSHHLNSSLLALQTLVLQIQTRPIFCMYSLSQPLHTDNHLDFCTSIKSQFNRESEANGSRKLLIEATLTMSFGIPMKTNEVWAFFIQKWQNLSLKMEQCSNIAHKGPRGPLQGFPYAMHVRNAPR